MSVRNTILENLQTTLEGISSVANVTRVWPKFAQYNKTQLPAFYIGDDGGERIAQICTGGKRQCVMRLMVICKYYPGSGGIGRLSELFSGFLDDVYQAIADDQTLGGTARHCEIESVDPIDLIPDDNLYVCDVNLEIKFVRTL